MATSEELTDAYLAALLAKDATKTSRSVVNRPRDAPKPNLRFLRNILKETDSHNAVLLERDRQLASRGARGLRTSHGVCDHDGEDRSAKRRRTERPDRWSSALAQQGLRRKDDDDKTGIHRQKRDRGDQTKSHESRHHSRSRSPLDRRGPSRHRDRSRDKHKQRSRSLQERDHPRRHRDRSREKHKHNRRSRSPSPHKRSSARVDGRSRAVEKTYESDSDPLEAIVGPRAPPKVIPRGRGTTAASSGIDARFANAHYDPSKDVQRDADEDDDWDMAMSALQDRAKWRAIGADRLRAAGFSEAEVAKWEGSSDLAPSGRDEDIDNVIWRKHGEARDWDRGKVTTADGETTTKAAWLNTS
ncbi:hypothetical protein AMS68_004753 [Peltaster fructicola]|uniref:Pre-mRNA-splicing factor 38B n=1 Tax=Peltaster fructicola TaxID=286661 RepID=A0A6H0XX26_9PEZI|nr:hypothetical protein AMS68_004753 [Peltaster fructicola]